MKNPIDNSRINPNSHLLDFTEWNPNPIVEINLKGELTYFNLAARAQFPNLSTLGVNHPILSGLMTQIGDLMKVQGEFVVFFRELNYMNSIYEQQLFSIAEKTSFFIYMNDITSRKHAEEQLNKKNIELAETTYFLNNILESSIEYSIVATDLSGNILTWNTGAENNYGYKATEMIGKFNLRTLHIPEDIQSGRIQRFIDAVLIEGKGESTFEQIRKNGEHFIASVTMSVRKGAAGNPIGYLLILKDITEQRRLEEQLRINMELEEQNILIQEANRLKTEFLANMSHELRTPLNAVIGFSDFLYVEGLGPLNESQKEALADILLSAKNLLQIITDLLDITNIQFARMEFKPENINLRKLVNEVTDHFYVLSLKKRINLSLNIEENITTVYLDPARFKQVFYNYLSNALKFTPEKGSVSIRILPEGEFRFRLEVEDNGGGIKTEDVKKLFVDFQQLDSGTTKKYAGTGLGLSLTKHIVEAQGGKVGAICTEKKNIFYAILPRNYRPEKKVSSKKN